MFAVVKNEEEIFFGKGLKNRFAQILFGLVTYAERGGDIRGKERSIVQRREVNEIRAVVKIRRNARGTFQREPRFAAAARANQRNDARALNFSFFARAILFRQRVR